MASPISGESWFAVETTASLSPFSTSHAQPEPKRVAAAFSNSALKLSTEPKSRSIAAFRSPCRVVPFFSPFQNRLWLAWPPALLRSTVFLSTGT
ncbi:Uncharacterised protein [Salmonella enterica subsp. enterica serovar Bovismorbificans]|uniref:Uncharacterized protein n=1 Tax=Salmonella enterica subsp. enterica serovar Bovismorbificans TaxID=58097 RepID=A0A655BZ81_SALET|nr:Uncharacterised protein [Salmonella enterica subsp. enterica serovar Bovismorbificans]